MGVVVYKSTDSSAPALNGNAGSLVTLLDAVLVNGYGSKAAAGWTKSFSGTNAASYRMGGGNQLYLDLNDNNPNGTALGREAAGRGYEAMTALATGTNPWPTTGQAASPGMAIRKSTSNDGVSRTWVAVADSKTLIFFCQPADSAGRWDGFYFGEFYSLVASDSYKCAFIAKGSNFNNSGSMHIDTEDLGNNQSGHYFPRNSAGTVATGDMTKFSMFGNGVQSTLSSDAGPSQDGNYYVSPYFVGSAQDHHLRGKLRGLWRLPSGVDGDTFSGTGDLSGRTFLVLANVGNGQVSLAIETSDTWDVSS